ncbi:hypothetical protein [Streptomyces sp. NPDC047525]|uniref:hypothetical protein n=1 Tax=Streptomyces sp. NPDC047525 TaxID=3155264 RepID=UPI0033C11784
MFPLDHVRYRSGDGLHWPAMRGIAGETSPLHLVTVRGLDAGAHGAVHPASGARHRAERPASNPVEVTVVRTAR